MDSCKACDWIEKAKSKPNLIWANERWVLRHSAAPYPALGWMTMHSRRHIPGAIAFNDAEAKEFGDVIRKVSQAQVDATGAVRVYLGSLSEGTPHFHVHLVPRYEGGPKSWDAFNDLARAREGLTVVDAARVEEVISQVGAQLVAQLGGTTRQP